jgi:hypothetical protein
MQGFLLKPSPDPSERPPSRILSFVVGLIDKTRKPAKNHRVEAEINFGVFYTICLPRSTPSPKVMKANTITIIISHRRGSG